MRRGRPGGPAAARDALPAGDRGGRRPAGRARVRRPRAGRGGDRAARRPVPRGRARPRPAGYGDADRHPLLQPTDPVVDAGELALARAAERCGLPVLGICRGAQALNVLRGGTLHQHVDGHLQDAPAPVPVASRRGRGRLAPRRADGGRPARRQLLPPPGRRPPRRRPARRRDGAGRHRRGDRGPARAVPRRRAVARRGDDGRARAARAVRRARRGRRRAAPRARRLASAERGRERGERGVDLVRRSSASSSRAGSPRARIR